MNCETSYIIEKISESISIDRDTIVLDYGSHADNITKELNKCFGCNVIALDLGGLKSDGPSSNNYCISDGKIKSDITSGLNANIVLVSTSGEYGENIENHLKIIESSLSNKSRIFVFNDDSSCLTMNNNYLWKSLTEKFKLSEFKIISSSNGQENSNNEILLGIYKKNNNKKNNVSGDLKNELYIAAQNYHQIGKIELSILLYEILISNPEVNSDVIHYLGLAKYQVGDYQNGINLMLDSIKLEPNNNDYRNNIAKAYSNMCKYDEAKSHLEHAINNDKNDIKQINDLGKLYLETKDYSEAESLFKRVIDIEPSCAEAFYYLGDLYKTQSKKNLAIRFYKESNILNPDNTSVLNNLGVIFAEYGGHSSANKYFSAVLKINPDDIRAYSDYLFNLNYQSKLNPETVFNKHKEFGDKYDNTASIFEFSKITYEDKKINIGYISPDLYHHSVSYFIESIFNCHNHDRFNIFVYNDSHIHDQMSERLRKTVDVWRETAPLNDEQLAKLIFNDDINILVDLAGHTSRHNRMRVFIMKPAPVQITYLGYPNTTGLSTIDYKITDKWCDPIGEVEQFYTENLLRLEKGFLCYTPQKYCPDINKKSFLSKGHVTFASFNNFTKINVETLSLWVEILKATGESHLILKAKQFSDVATKNSIIEYFEKRGVKKNRLEFIVWFDSYEEHMEYYNRIDIALDTHPYNGTTTTCESLWMGVPVITLAGVTHISRVGVSILKQVGLEEFIAYSPEEYIKIAVTLSKNDKKIIKLNKCLRKIIGSSSLINAKEFTIELEKKYESVYLKNKNDKKIIKYLNKASQLSSLRKYSEAIKYYEQILLLDKNNADVNHAIGVALGFLGDLDKAKKHLDKTLLLQPNNPDAYLNLANIVKAKGCYNDAIIYLVKALELKPNFAEAENSLGLCWNGLGNMVKAVECFNRAIKINPNLYQAYNNLGNAFLGLVKVNDAINAFKMSMHLKSDFYMAHSNYLYALLYQESIDAEKVYVEHANYGKRFDSLKKFNFINEVKSNKRIRVGYLSPDFCRHPVIFFIEAIIANHNHQKFEIYAYDDTHSPDEMTKRIETRVDKWRRIKGLDDEDVINIIKNDRIDILIDLAGHTGNNRLQIFGKKPAPIQVSYLGYPHSTGLPMMDYRITDKYADPNGYTEQYHSEKLIRLPDCFLCYQAPDNHPDISPLPMIVNSYITFGSFNNFTKVNTYILGLWAELLLVVPKSRLIIKAKQLRDNDICQRVKLFFESRGISSERIELIAWFSTYDEHMGFYSKVDIGLDTYPYHGTTTTCEALYMGIPVVTLAGETHLSRVGVSILKQVGLDELVAESAEAYVTKALKLASNVEMLSTIRKELRGKMDSSPLTKGGLFVKNLEKEYLNIWKKWCEKRETMGNENKVKYMRRLHIGGKIIHPDWEILDVIPGEHVNHIGNADDLNQFDNETFDEIYASHVLEHFDFSNGGVNKVLVEWHRILKHGGKLYISVPDMDKLFSLFINNSLNANQKFDIIRMIFGGHVNQHDYHKIGFNKEILSAFLIDTGFKKNEIVERFGIFNDTSDFQYEGVAISLNIIAEKEQEN
jgi:predicted O-linked N-acetylglucosamine transferase (SPINDLY family)/predicted SAM-dependent methyltransferase